MGWALIRSIKNTTRTHGPTNHAAGHLSSPCSVILSDPQLLRLRLTPLLLSPPSPRLCLRLLHRTQSSIPTPTSTPPRRVVAAAEMQAAAAFNRAAFTARPLHRPPRPLLHLYARLISILLSLDVLASQLLVSRLHVLISSCGFGEFCRAGAEDALAGRRGAPLTRPRCSGSLSVGVSSYGSGKDGETVDPFNAVAAVILLPLSRKQNSGGITSML